MGNADDDVYVDEIVPALTSAHGAYFDGDDIMELPRLGEVIFDKDFSVEMFIRFS